MNILEQISTYAPEFFTLAIAHFFAVASPGPDFAVVTKNTINYGKRIGRITALGVGVAILLHVTYALLGFSLLVQSNELLYTIIKWAGALFLIYLGYGSLSSKPKDFNQIEASSTSKILVTKAFSSGFFTNAFNVKALLFFLFLFTSLVENNTPVPVKLFYGAWLSLYTFLWFYFIASVFGYQPVRAFFTKFGVWFDRIMGVILIGLAIWLLVK